MTDRSASRNQAHQFLRQLMRRADVAIDDDGPLRHLGIAALNLATESDARTLLAASRSLSWFALLCAWEEGPTDFDALTRLVTDGRLAPHLTGDFIRRRLLEATKAPTAAIRRQPQAPTAPTERLAQRAQILADLADQDRCIEATAALAPHRQFCALFEDTQLLSTTLALAHNDELPPAAAQLVSRLPSWTDPTGRALDVLAAFERRDFEATPPAMTPLGERAQRFEQSMGQHLQRHGLLPAVRAALALAPEQNQATDDDRARWRQCLNQATIFSEDPTLVELTLALISLRHRTLAHLRGELPLAALGDWIEYLRGPCAEFGERRGITLRESTNFAHYALHLLNCCDLAADSRAPLTDTVRRALMDIEDELKEFALVGQRQGLPDRQADLGRYEQTRWRGDGAGAHFASRLARLCGAWRAGHRAGPPGAAPRPDHELFDACLALVDTDDDTLTQAIQLLPTAHLVGLPALEDWSPRQVLSMLTPLLLAARATDEIDVDSPYILDFTALADWLAGAQKQQRIQILSTIADHPRHGPEVLLTADQGLVARPGTQRLYIDFCPSPQLEAIVTLLAADDLSDDGDALLAASLRQKLSDLLAVPASPAGDEPDPGPPTTWSTTERP